MMMDGVDHVARSFERLTYWALRMYDRQSQCYYIEYWPKQQPSDRMYGI